MKFPSYIDNPGMRQRVQVLCIYICSFLIAGCATDTQQLPAENVNGVPKQLAWKVSMNKRDETKLEPVSGVSFNGSVIKANVVSHGCTSETNFTVNHHVEQGVCMVSIIKTKPDLCRRAPMLARVALDWSLPDDCKELEMVIANPVLNTSDEGKITKRLKKQ